MPNRPDAALQEKLNERLRFYEDLGLGPFYRDRGVAIQRIATSAAVAPEALSVVIEESTLRKAVPKLTTAVKTVGPESAARLPILPTATGLSLFEASDKILGDTLLKTREDLGECTRCKLHKTRHKIVFGDGSPKADLVFIGEGPGADEDAQGLPFVGRAGKLLTQMIEAMGLRRGDVYICNVVKCRPPENRQPEKDEVTACSPFLFRQLDVLKPKVIVCLGSTAAQTLLQTNRGISHFRGEWLDFRGYKMLATYHPAYLLRNPGAKGEVWKDLQKVMAELGLEVKKNKAK
jgi:uracil-DNA glycosylase family 4